METLEILLENPRKFFGDGNYGWNVCCLFSLFWLKKGGRLQCCSKLKEWDQGEKMWNNNNNSSNDNNKNNNNK
jgi:hypothetical protein